MDFGTRLTMTHKGTGTPCYKRDFRGVDKFNPCVLDARELLFEIGEISRAH